MGKHLFNLKKKSKVLRENLGNINLLTPKIFPKEEAKKKFKHYFEKLHSAIYSNDATNIAVTGSYGSGKTTIIKNYQNVYDKEETGREYLNISLATFKEETTKESNLKKNISIKTKSDEPINEGDSDFQNNSKDRRKEKQNLERLIELSILQQILYHVEPSTIPNSNLKRISSIKPNLLFWITALCLVWLFTTTILFKFNYISKINPYSWDFNLPLDRITLILVLVFLTGLGFIIHKGIRLLNGTKVSKLKFLESEIELGRDVNKSILNEHLDEIIYFFQRTKYDVVVFEDIDRFENTEIFTKLREMNHLLNKSKLIKRELGKIVFIYAVRDDKFKNEERTKFFDYIIPIIPFVSPTNANEQLWKLIKQEGLKDTFTKNFIDDVVTFIDDIDMRLLTNIFNEFLIYKSKQLHNDENKKRNDNLLAIIIYKNLYPKDFAQLPKRKGDLFEIINQKKKYVEEKIKKINVEISILDKYFSEVSNENIKNTRELRAIYINAIHKIVPDAFEIVIGSNNYDFSDLLDEDVFEELKIQERIKCKYFTELNNTYHKLLTRTTESSFEDVEKIVNDKFSYDERVEFIENKADAKLNEIKRKIEAKKKNKIDVESWDLAQIFQELNILPDTSKFDNSRLIKYLLLDGYINEHYHHNISLFHEENLSKEDFDFERMVKTAENSPFDYELKEIKELVQKIDVRFFERPAILNFDLLNYLLDNQQREKKNLSRIFKLLANENERVILFIDAYLEAENLKQDGKKENLDPVEFTNIEPFIKLLSKNWVRFWDYIYLDSNYSKEKEKMYISYIIKYSEIEDLAFFKNGSNINTYIMQQPDFLTFFEKEHHDKVKEVISGLSIEFELLEQPTFEVRDLFHYVYENNHYKINIPMIDTLLKIYDSDTHIGGDHSILPKVFFYTNNYETILKSKNTNLIDYINSNINIYVKKVYLKLEKNNAEREEILIDNFFTNTLLEIDLKIKIIDKTNTVFTSLEKIENVELKKKLIKENKIQPSWENVLNYIDTYEKDNIKPDGIIDFYNEENNYLELNKKSMTLAGEYSEDFYKSISKSILLSEEIKIEAYRKLINSTGYVYSSLNFNSLSEDKVEALINKPILSLSEDNFTKLKNNFPNKHIDLIEKYQNKFIEDITPFNIDNGDLAMIIESNKISDSIKLKLLDEITPESLSNNLKLSIAVLDFILKNKNLKLSIDKITNIISHKISTTSRVNLLILYGKEKLSKNELINLLTLLPISFKKIATKSQTTIPKNESNRKLIEVLQYKGIVSEKVKVNKWNEYRLWMKKL